MPATLPTETITLAGEIDLHRSQEVKEALAAPIQRKTSRILLDLSSVSYIDSSGLAVLIEALQRVLGYGGKFGLFGLQESVRNIFGIARLDQVFQIYPDESAALADC
jgi:anti-sigma B factor antagonist